MTTRRSGKSSNLLAAIFGVLLGPGLIIVGFLSKGQVVMCGSVDMSTDETCTNGSSTLDYAQQAASQQRIGNILIIVGIVISLIAVGGVSMLLSGRRAARPIGAP